MSFPRSCDVAVVGLGAMGSAALSQLAKRGVNVVGIDRFFPAHDKGSTHCETRIARQAIGENAVHGLTVSPCSGHGFKHSAAIGEIAAQCVIDGKTTIDISTFTFSRFSDATD